MGQMINKSVEEEKLSKRWQNRVWPWFMPHASEKGRDGEIRQLGLMGFTPSSVVNVAL